MLIIHSKKINFLKFKKVKIGFHLLYPALQISTLINAGSIIISKNDNKKFGVKNEN